MKKKLLMALVIVGVMTISSGCYSLQITNTKENSKEDSKSEYLMDTDEREINSEELKGKSELELNFLKNEILARHGMIFKDDETMQTYFNKKSWYAPNPSYTIKDLSDVELYNYKLICEYIDSVVETTKEESTQATTVQAIPDTQMAVNQVPNGGNYTAPTNPARPSITYYCRASDYATIRTYASTKSSELGRLPCRAACQYLGDYGEFLKISYNGIVGYVRTDLISTDYTAPLYYGD